MATLYIEEKTEEFYRQCIEFLKTGAYSIREMQEKFDVKKYYIEDKIKHLYKNGIIDKCKVNDKYKYFIIADDIEIIVRNDMATSYKQQKLDEFLKNLKRISKFKLIDFGAKIGYPHSCACLIQYAQRKGVEVIK